MRITSQLCRKQIAHLEEELKDFKNVEMSNMSDDTERKIKSLVREWERRIAVVEAEREQVIFFNSWHDNFLNQHKIRIFAK